MADLMDRRPVTVEGELSDAPDDVRIALLSLPWVIDAKVRLREEGHVFTGELFITARSTEDLGEKIEDARRASTAVDWRIHDVVVEISDRGEQ